MYETTFQFHYSYNQSADRTVNSILLITATIPSYNNMHEEFIEHIINVFQQLCIPSWFQIVDNLLEWVLYRKRIHNVMGIYLPAVDWVNSLRVLTRALRLGISLEHFPLLINFLLAEASGEICFLSTESAVFLLVSPVFVISYITSRMEDKHVEQNFNKL